ncbi:MAG: hypothetical protein JSW71_07810, partial [Gemmatimonadota bacterium]
MRRCFWVAWLGWLLILWTVQTSATGANEVEEDAWRGAIVASLASNPAQAVTRAIQEFPGDRLPLEIVADWLIQDALADDWSAEKIGRVVDALGQVGNELRQQLRTLCGAAVPVSDPRWAELYLAACQTRRGVRFQPHRDRLRRIVFTKHYDLGGSHYAYTEGQSDAQNERHFKAGTSLCVLEMDGLYGKARTLVDDPKGVIRDPDVSY